jgi:RNA polymerase sigma factor for flagellar operon FliA
VLALDDLWTITEGDGGRISLLDTVSDPQAVDPEAEMHAVELKDRLADADRGAARSRAPGDRPHYYENLTLREIGEVLAATESRVSQLDAKAVLGLRGTLASR